MTQNPARVIQERLARVWNLNHGDVGKRNRPLTEYAGRPATGCFLDVVVAIPFLSFDGQKQLARVEQARIVTKIGEGAGVDRP